MQEPMDHQWTRCYRMRPYFRNVGLIGTIFFAAVGLASTLAAYLNLDGAFARPNPAGLLFGLFWSAFTFLGIWLLLLYYRYRLLVSDSSLRQIGVVRDNQIAVNLVDKLEWRRFPRGGSVRMSGIFGVLKIDLGNFNTEHREELVAFLRQALTESRQIGWEQFNEQLADTPEGRKRLRRAHVLLIFVLGAHAIGFGIIWAVGRELLYLALSGVNALVAAYLIRAHLRDLAASATNSGELSGD